jgi:glucokinase
MAEQLSAQSRDGGSCLAIGVDVGGTRIKIGLVELASGRVVASRVVPTVIDSPASFAALIGTETTALLAAATIPTTRVTGIGIGMPGYVEADRVTALPATLVGLEGQTLASAFQDELSLPLRIDNDARLIALGECRLGSHPPAHRFLSLTIGTGIGLGLVIDGRLRERTSIEHLAAHFPVRPGARQCYCGFSGCFEILAAAGRLAEDAARLGLPGPEAVLAAGTADAVAVIRSYLDDLATGLNALAYIMAPDMIVLGGGLAPALQPFLPELEQRIFARPVPGYRLAIRITRLAEKAGIIGAACQFIEAATAPAC